MFFFKKFFYSEIVCGFVLAIMPKQKFLTMQTRKVLRLEPGQLKGRFVNYENEVIDTDVSGIVFLLNEKDPTEILGIEGVLFLLNGVETLASHVTEAEWVSKEFIGYCHGASREADGRMYHPSIQIGFDFCEMQSSDSLEFIAAWFNACNQVDNDLQFFVMALVMSLADVEATQ